MGIPFKAVVVVVLAVVSGEVILVCSMLFVFVELGAIGRGTNSEELGFKSTIGDCEEPEEVEGIKTGCESVGGKL